MRVRKPIKQIVRSLGKLSEKWLDPAFGFRRKALRALEIRCGYSTVMGEEILDDLFSELTEKKLWALLEDELGNPEVLDRFCEDNKNFRRVRAFGPEMITHIFSANAPNPSVVSIVLGLLVKSTHVAKISREDSGLLTIYLRSLRRQDPALGAMCKVIQGQGSEALTKALRSSGAVIAYGGAESIAYFFKKVSPQQVFMPYGHRMSFAVYLKGAFSPRSIASLAKKTARDLWLMDQKGCLSPLVIFIQKKGKAAFHFCEKLAEALKKNSSGSAPVYDFSHRIHALNNKKSRGWPAGAWRVLYDESPLSPPRSWGGRTALVKSFDAPETAVRALERFSPYLQAATLEGSPSETRAMAVTLAKLGFNRLCRAGRIQKPPLSWHHDGRMNLAPLLRWTDLEVRDGF